MLRYLIVCCCLVVILLSDVNCEGEEDNTDEKITDRAVREARIKKHGALLKRLIPLIAMPFIFQVTMLPAMMLTLKFMLFKGILLGKLAVLFGVLSLFRSFLSKGTGGLYSHNINLHDEHRRRIIVPADEPHHVQPEDYDNVGDYALSRLKKKLKTKIVPPFTYL